MFEWNNSNLKASRLQIRTHVDIYISLYPFLWLPTPIRAHICWHIQSYPIIILSQSYLYTCKSMHIIHDSLSTISLSNSQVWSDPRTFAFGGLTTFTSGCLRSIPSSMVTNGATDTGLGLFCSSGKDFQHIQCSACSAESWWNLQWLIILCDWDPEKSVMLIPTSM